METMIEFPGVASVFEPFRVQDAGVTSTVETVRIDFEGVGVDRADEGTFTLIVL